MEGFLSKIALALFSQALQGSGLSVISDAYHIYSSFSSHSSWSRLIASGQCGALNAAVSNIASDYIAEDIVKKAVAIGSDSFVVERTSSGVYIAQSSLVGSFRASGQLGSAFQKLQSRQTYV